jgi:hypothetical protein
MQTQPSIDVLQNGYSFSNGGELSKPLHPELNDRATTLAVLLVILRILRFDWQSASFTA